MLTKGTHFHAFRIHVYFEGIFNLPPYVRVEEEMQVSFCEPLRLLHGFTVAAGLGGKVRIHLCNKRKRHFHAEVVLWNCCGSLLKLCRAVFPSKGKFLPIRALMRVQS